MTNQARTTSGYILLTVPTIVYGGYFLLSVLSGQQDHLQLTAFQQSMFRAGHAHAGVLLILSLVAQLLADHMALPDLWKWAARLAFPLAAISISGGFFAAAIGRQVNEPSKLIIILYFGIALLVTAVLILGIGLIRKHTINH